jgi:hypothetical protein
VDNTILASLIGAGATIVAALLGLAAVLWSRRPPRTIDDTRDEGHNYKPPVRITARDQVREATASEVVKSQSVPHDGVTKFWLQYWQCVQSEFPVLSMNRPDKVPAGSDWPQFRNAGMGGGVYIIHKWREGFVDLTIPGAGDAVDQIRAQNQAALVSDMEVVRTSKSASIRLTVPPLDRFGDFERQRAKVREGLGAAARLLALVPKITSVLS